MRNTFVEIVCKPVPMSLKNPVNSALRKGVNQVACLIGHTAGLDSVLSPDSVGLVSITRIPKMTQYEHSICSIIPEDFAFSHHQIAILKEFIRRELLLCKGRSCFRSVLGAQTNDANANATGQFDQLGYFLFWQEDCIASLGPDVGCQIGPAFTGHVR